MSGKLGMSRQNYYAGRRERRRGQVDAELVVNLVREERRLQPRVGGRKLYVMLRPALAEAGIKLGRDQFFAVLRAHGLLVPPLPKRYARTTQHNPSLPVFANHIKDCPALGANRIWLADLTYVRTAEGFLYVSLISDQYSRKIVGHHAGETLAASEALKALEQALGDLAPGLYPCHHSDRGCQYCSHEYVEKLQARGLKISMTENNHCAENAQAERVNGILKQEYGLGGEFKTKAQGRRAIAQAIELYNHRRLHCALNYQVPARVHALSLAA